MASVVHPHTIISVFQIMKEVIIIDYISQFVLFFGKKTCLYPPINNQQIWTIPAKEIGLNNQNAKKIQISKY